MEVFECNDMYVLVCIVKQARGTGLYALIPNRVWSKCGWNGLVPMRPWPQQRATGGVPPGTLKVGSVLNSGVNFMV